MFVIALKINSSPKKAKSASANRVSLHDLGFSETMALFVMIESSYYELENPTGGWAMPVPVCDSLLRMVSRGDGMNISGSEDGGLSSANGVVRNSRFYDHTGDEGHGLAINQGHNILVSDSVAFHNRIHGFDLSDWPKQGEIYTRDDINQGAFQIGNLSVDPMFVNIGVGSFELLPGSPVVDAGVEVGQPFCGAAPDLGAIELCP